MQFCLKIVDNCGMELAIPLGEGRFSVHIFGIKKFHWLVLILFGHHFELVVPSCLAQWALIVLLHLKPPHELFIWLIVCDIQQKPSHMQTVTDTFIWLPVQTEKHFCANSAWVDLAHGALGSGEFDPQHGVDSADQASTCQVYGQLTAAPSSCYTNHEKMSLH